MKKLTLSILALALGLTAAQAGSSSYYYSSKAPAKDPIPLQPENCFYAGETFVDIFGIFADPDTRDGGQGGDLEDGYGGGVGLGHFFTEYLGARGRAYWWDAGSAIHSVNADLILRAPIQSLCIAPYIYGGIGGAFDGDNQFTQHIGGGLEARLTGRLGVFADYSRVFADDSGDWDLYSLGVRILF
jgi:hypothetical protein